MPFSAESKVVPQFILGTFFLSLRVGDFFAGDGEISQLSVNISLVKVLAGALSEKFVLLQRIRRHHQSFIVLFKLSLESPTITGISPWKTVDFVSELRW